MYCIKSRAYNKNITFVAISDWMLNSAKKSTLLKDFSEKVSNLDIDTKTKSNLETLAKQALLTSVKPAYNSLISFIKKQN